MFKYKKYSLYTLTILFIIFSLIELIIYLTVKSTIFGLIYLFINLLIIFLLVPCTYNYKKYYNPARISKFIIIILLGIFNSYILGSIVINGINYTDSSIDYMNKIFIFKNILKGIIYLALTVITIFEFKIDKVIKKSVGKSVD